MTWTEIKAQAAPVGEHSMVEGVPDNTDARDRDIANALLDMIKHDLLDHLAGMPESQVIIIGVIEQRRGEIANA